MPTSSISLSLFEASNKFSASSCWDEFERKFKSLLSMAAVLYWCFKLLFGCSASGVCFENIAVLASEESIWRPTADFRQIQVLKVVFSIFREFCPSYTLA